MNPFDAAVPASPKPAAAAPNPFDAATPATASGGDATGLEGLKKLWIKAGGDPASADLMAHVAESESSGNASATGPEYTDTSGKHRAHGLWQISDVHGNQNWNDPLTNAREAVALHRESGMAPWQDSRDKGGGGGWGQYDAAAPKPAVVAVAKPKAAEPDRWQPAKDFIKSLNRPIVATAEAAETGNPFDAPAVVAPIAAKPHRSLVDEAGSGALNLAAGGVKNLAHIGQGVLGALTAAQRGAAGVGHYVEENKLGDNVLAHPSAIGPALHEGAKWALDPKKQDAADKYDRHRFSTEDGGILPTDAQIDAHLNGLPATATRWGMQAASSVLGDPISFVPASTIAKGAKLIPGATHAAEAVSKSGVGRAASSLFNAEHHLGGLTEHGQNVVEGVRNSVKQAAEKAKRDEDLVISSARKDLKAGVIDKPVADLFKKYKLPVPAGPQVPSKVMHAIEEARHAGSTKAISEQLRKLDLIEGNSGAAHAGINGPGMHPDDFFKAPVRDAAARAEARAGVAEHIKPSAAADTPLGKLSAKVNNQLKGMFLAVPLPHVANLVNLSYQKYGLATTLRGLHYAVQESTGARRAHFVGLVNELQKAGADNQYSKIFSEVNDFGGGSVRQVQRFANAAQDKILNPVERGLRASMIEKEMKAGKQGFDAARNVHKALGTDAETGLTKTLNRLPISQFPRFHTQTSIGSTLRTIADKPGRVTGFEHVFGGPDQKKDGKAHYHLSTPTASGLKLLDNPLNYLSSASTLGGLADVTSPYSPIGLLKKAYSEQSKGKRRAADRDYAKVVTAVGGKVLPLSGSVAALSELARKKRGEMKESGLQDLVSSLGGGYWSKQ